MVDLSNITDLSTTMGAIEYWAQIAVYVVIGIVIAVILCVVYRILGCACCLLKCFLPKKKECRQNLISYEDHGCSSRSLV